MYTALLWIVRRDTNMRAKCDWRIAKKIRPNSTIDRIAPLPSSHWFRRLVRCLGRRAYPVCLVYLAVQVYQECRGCLPAQTYRPFLVRSAMPVRLPGARQTR